MIQLDDILGQSEAVELITKALICDRLPHGMIFAGPTGVGKGTTATALAGVFLCEKPKGARACGNCDSCRVFAAGNHPDYHLIYKELIRVHDKTGKSKGVDLSINVIRPELVEPAGRKSVLGRGKVFVIEQAELMNAQAQNAMLKTLEEPAGRSLIILLTDQASVLLPTIRSRCQLVQFNALDDKLVIAALEKRNIDASTAAHAARFSEGSLGLSLRWIEDGVISRAVEFENMLLSTGNRGDMADWLKAAAEAYSERQLKRDDLTSKDQATRDGMCIYLRVASQVFRRKLRTTNDADAQENLCDAIETLTKAEKYLDANVTISLIFQQVAATLDRNSYAQH